MLKSNLKYYLCLHVNCHTQTFSMASRLIQSPDQPKITILNDVLEFGALLAKSEKEKGSLVLLFFEK